jgi:hypothetical protein
MVYLVQRQGELLLVVLAYLPFSLSLLTSELSITTNMIQGRNAGDSSNKCKRGLQRVCVKVAERMCKKN